MLPDALGRQPFYASSPRFISFQLGPCALRYTAEGRAVAAREGRCCLARLPGPSYFPARASAFLIRALASFSGPSCSMLARTAALASVWA